MIYVGFGTNNKLRSKLIRWATKSKWSHAWIEYHSDLWGGVWAVHSHKQGVVKVPFEQIYEEYTKRKIYQCDCDTERGFAWASKRVGLQYDYGVIWNGILLVLYGLFGWEFLWKLVVRDAARMSCSEFVAGFLKAAEIEGMENFDPELTTSGMLEKFCFSSKDFTALGRMKSRDDLAKLQ
jgi:hypothetical protein